MNSSVERLDCLRKDMHPRGVAHGILAVTLMFVLVGCQQPGQTTSSAAPSLAPIANGVLLGGIWPCPPDDYLGLSTYTPPNAFQAGSVVVFKGSVTWQPAPNGGSVRAYPTDEVTSQTVPSGGLYRFRLPPGDYAVIAIWRPGFSAWANVAVVAGQTTVENTPDPQTCW